MILIDNITAIDIDTTTSATSLTVPHTITSQDAVLIVLAVATGTDQLLVQFNGNTMIRIATRIDSGGNSSQIYYLANPPVGTYDVFATNYLAGLGGDIVAISLLGVDKSYTPLTFDTSGTVAPIALSVNSPAPNSLVIDCLRAVGTGTRIIAPNKNQTPITFGDTSSNYYISSSYKFIQSEFESVLWNLSSGTLSNYAYTAVVLEPKDSPSLFRPFINLNNNTISTRSDVDPALFFLGYKPSVFWQNSFLHTIGRFHPPPPATLTSETEQETSQIIIDKIVQGQIGGGSTLNLQVSIPSQDAVLVVTGGSVIATGGAWQSVKFNGVSLTKLVQAGVAGNSAEIWYMQNPPVGVYTLSVIPTATFGEAYVNAVVLLGVDKRDKNFITASITDAASTATITATITPDAPNSLIIDCIAALDPVAVPVPDASQTQMFNATAINNNEAVLSTFKLSSNTQNTMNYNLSTSVNAALVAVCFRPANHASIWFPNIDTREIDDVVTVSDLDAGLNPAFGSYGYKPSTFYLNSYFHTIGRNIKPANPIVVVSTTGSTLLMLGVG